MSAVISLFGASVGVGLRWWANNLGKQHALARPWNYVGCALIGGYVGYHYNKWEDDLLLGVNAERVSKGMQPYRRESLLTDLSGKVTNITKIEL